MSAPPIPYTRQANFTNFSTEQFPTTGQDLEAEFNKLAQSVGSTQSRLAEIQRDDGLLANLSVHPDSLSHAVRSLLAAEAGVPRGNWAPGVIYQPKDVVMHAGASYLAATEHTAGADFDADLAAGKWLLLSFANDGGTLRVDLASPAPGNGASLVQYDADETVKDRLDALSSGGGAALVGFQQAGAGAVVRNAQDKMREWVTPEDFGAVGDGVADDTVPVQNAINVGRVVRFRPGATYRITSSLIVPSNTTIIAHGAKVIRGANGLNNLIRNYADGVTGGTNAATNITIDGGEWDGGDDSQGVITVMAFGHCNRITVRNATIRRVPHWHHIELNGAADVLIENCRFWDGASYGVDTGEAIQLDHASNSTSFPWFGPYDGTACGGIRISNCSFNYNSSGIGTHSTPGTGRHQDIVIENCSFFGIYGYGIRMRQWSGVRVVNCRFQACYMGIHMESFNGQVPRDVLIQGNTFFNIGAGGNPGTSGVGISIAGASEDARYADVRIVGNFISGMDGSHGASALVAFYTDRLVVEGNTITSPVVHGMWLQGIKNSVINGNSCYGASSPNFDIRLGYETVATVTSNNIVTGNACGRIGVDNTTRCLVRDNVANAIDVTGSNIGTVTTGNLVAGTMT